MNKNISGKKEMLERISKMMYASSNNIDWFYYVDPKLQNMFGGSEHPSLPATLVLQFNGGQFDVNNMVQSIKDLIAALDLGMQHIEELEKRNKKLYDIWYENYKTMTEAVESIDKIIGPPEEEEPEPLLPPISMWDKFNDWLLAK